MSPPNFSIYLNSLLSIKRGDNEDHPERVLSKLEDWGHTEVQNRMVLVTRKGINVLEFYLKNREFNASNSSDVQESGVKGIHP